MKKVLLIFGFLLAGCGKKDSNQYFSFGAEPPTQQEAFNAVMRTPCAGLPKIWSLAFAIDFDQARALDRRLEYCMEVTAPHKKSSHTRPYRYDPHRHIWDESDVQESRR